MKILIKGDAVKQMIKKVPAQAGFTREQMGYHDSVRKIQGTWVNIDTSYCFEDQFNTVDFEDSMGLRIMCESVEDIDFEDLGELGYKKKCTDWYNEAWEGRVPNFYHIDRILFENGKRKFNPVKQIEWKRGYDSYGKPINKNEISENKYCTQK